MATAEQQQNDSVEKNEGQSRHQEVGHKSLLQSDALYQYILETSVYPREPESMKELREITAKHPWNIMTTSADGAVPQPPPQAHWRTEDHRDRVFTGYSLLATALALPDDGKILAMDINRENFEIGLPVMEKAGVAHKVDFREGPGLPLLDQIRSDPIRSNQRTGEEPRVIRFRLRGRGQGQLHQLPQAVDRAGEGGGVIGYDNTLWNGSVVAPPDAPMRKYVRYYRDFVLELNKALAADPRIEICQLPVGDGITLCRRII
ncbi:unnamed protein product [Spirodela intermedia]|uniref:Uncharacterized protein n=1 Tax=Spirodela intermedia TaxID=51605 RepID=A0A7I8IUG4_SPIIN|nr:unnamed protein product [Spirodela intermedia]CAA6661419.1 unnamed protein product [Spirodela intermedia]